LENQPPVAITHFAFQVMVGCGMFLMATGLVFFIALYRKKNWLQSNWFLKLIAIATPLGFLALEAGWTVTEVGRQPWIIYGVMRTSEALTPMPGIQYSFYLFTVVYISLSLIVVFLLFRQIKSVPELYDKEPMPNNSLNYVLKNL
jgi:cytochrome d ubiquinol oxidase subunit I